MQFPPCTAGNISSWNPQLSCETANYPEMSGHAGKATCGCSDRYSQLIWSFHNPSPGFRHGIEKSSWRGILLVHLFSPYLFQTPLAIGVIQTGLAIVDLRRTLPSELFSDSWLIEFVSILQLLLYASRFWCGLLCSNSSFEQCCII